MKQAPIRNRGKESSELIKRNEPTPVITNPKVNKVLSLHTRFKGPIKKKTMTPTTPRIKNIVAES